MHVRITTLQAQNLLREQFHWDIFETLFLSNEMRFEAHPESKDSLCIQSAHLFCCSRSLVSGVQCDDEICPLHLYVGPCHMVNAGIALAIENPADCEVRGVISFLQADEILSYLAEQTSTRMECSVTRQCTCAYWPVITNLAAWVISLGHLRASSVQSGPGPVGFFPFSKNGETYW